MSEHRKTPYIVTDPKMKGGTPSLVGRRLTAEMIAERYWWLGESLEAEILTQYDLTRADVLVCCWWLANHGNRRQRQRWRPWLLETETMTGWSEGGKPTGWWSTDWSDIPLPPTRKQIEAMLSDISAALDEVRRADEGE